MKEITFAAFSDFHYKEGMYCSTVGDFEEILERAREAEAAFLLHTGDFCNDYLGSPELIRRYLANCYQLPVYGLYGNHELESTDNCMAVVTPSLTNDRAVCWGTANGKIGDGSVGYYYFDKDGFRFVMADTNYSFDGERFVHNLPQSWGPPAGNTRVMSLGPTQLAWLDGVLTDAAERGLHCVVASHSGFCTAFDGWNSPDADGNYSPDAEAVLALYRKANARRPGTVLLSLNGDYHDDRYAVIDGVLHFALNAAINGYWREEPHGRYTGTHPTYHRVRYAPNGDLLEDMGERPVTEAAWMMPQTMIYERPLSCTITLREDGRITVRGMQTDWRAGIQPPPERLRASEHPWISSLEINPVEAGEGT